MLSGVNPRKSAEIVQRIRYGQDFSHILKQMHHGDMLLQKSLNSQQHARQVFLSNLMGTNASFDDLVDFMAHSIVTTTNVHIPNASVFRQLRGQQVGLDTLRELVGIPAPQRRIAISDLLSDGNASSPPSKDAGTRSTPSGHQDDQTTEPPFKVPAKPWTNLADDELVSHLISIFLEWINPCWRAVEQDLFVEALRSGDPNSLYCSPFLVNSILALASVRLGRLTT